MSPFTLSVKDPDDLFDVGIDWGRWLAGIDDGDTIVTSEWILETGDITINDTLVQAGDLPPHEHDGRVTAVWIKGGRHGRTSYITNRIKTTEGRQFDQSIEVNVKNSRTKVYIRP